MMSSQSIGLPRANNLSFTTGTKTERPQSPKYDELAIASADYVWKQLNQKYPHAPSQEPGGQAGASNSNLGHYQMFQYPEWLEIYQQKWNQRWGPFFYWKAIKRNNQEVSV